MRTIVNGTIVEEITTITVDTKEQALQKVKTRRLRLRGMMDQIAQIVAEKTRLDSELAAEIDDINELEALANKI